jgi:hypothetical protein
MFPMSLSDLNAQKDTTEFALPTKRISAKKPMKQNAIQSTRTTVSKLTEMLKSPTLKMFALIKTLQSATNIGNVKIQTYLSQIVTIKFG